MTDAFSNRNPGAEATDQPEVVMVNTPSTPPDAVPTVGPEPATDDSPADGGSGGGWASPADLMAWMDRLRSTSGESEETPGESDETSGESAGVASGEPSEQEDTTADVAPEPPVDGTAAAVDPVGVGESVAREQVYPTEAIPLAPVQQGATPGPEETARPGGSAAPDDRPEIELRPASSRPGAAPPESAPAQPEAAESGAVERDAEPGAVERDAEPGASESEAAEREAEQDANQFARPQPSTAPALAPPVLSLRPAPRTEPSTPPDAQVPDASPAPSDSAEDPGQGSGEEVSDEGSADDAGSSAVAGAVEPSAVEPSAVDASAVEPSAVEPGEDGPGEAEPVVAEPVGTDADAADSGDGDHVSGHAASVGRSLQEPGGPGAPSADEVPDPDLLPTTAAIGLPFEVFAPAASPRPVPLPPAAPEPDSVLEPEPESEPESVPESVPGTAWGTAQADGPDVGAPTALLPPVSARVPVPPPALPVPRRRRRAPLVAALVVGAGVIGGGAAALAARDLVPRGTTVGGVDVGGMRREAAVRTLAARVADASTPIPVAVGGRQATLDPATVQLRLDAERSVDEVLGGTFDASRIWHQVIGGGDEPAVPEPDRAALRTGLEAIAAGTAQAPADGDVTFETAGPRAVAAVTGTALDVDAAVDVVATGWLARSGALELPVRRTEPAITQAEVDRALADQARPAASGPLTVVIGDTTVQVTQAALQPTLSMAPAATSPKRLELVVDGAALRTAVLAAADGLEQKPQDARIVLKDGVPTIIPSKDGVSIDPTALAAAARTALATPERKAVLASAVAKPSLTTEQAKALGVKEKVSTFSTNYPPNADRTNNLRIAARTVNGTLVLPGKVFSLNEVLGKRTPEKGYAQAPTIMNGRLVPGYGGGVSQMATTIFNAMFFAGLEDVHHMPHSFYISRYPEGREATVNYPNVDLKWRNDSPYGVLVEASITSTVNVSFWSTKQYDEVQSIKSARSNPRQPKTIHDTSATCVAQAPTSGFDVSVRRKVIKDGAVVKDQTWRTTYIAEDRVVCGPEPADPRAGQGPGRRPGQGAGPDTPPTD